MKIGIVALGLLLVAPAVLAQSNQESARQAASERSAMLKTLERGKAMKGSRDRYRHLPQLCAVALADSETPEQAIARAGDAGAQLVETKGRLVLYRSSSMKPAYVQSAAGTSVFPIVVNDRTGSLGVLTGNLIVKPRDMADADAIASGRGMEKIKAYPQLQVVFYRAKAGVDIADISAALQADPRVESAYPEIVERVRVPK